MLMACVLASAPVVAHTDDTGPGAPLAAPLSAWQEQEARLHRIGWQIVSGNAAFCARRNPALGLLLHDAGSYTDPAAVRAALGLAGPIGVQAVAPASPAEAAGLRANDAVLALDGESLPLEQAADTAAWQRMARINEAIDASLRRDGVAELAWRRQDGATAHARIAGVPACVSRFELLHDGRRVMADGERVLIGRRFSGFALPDPLLAAAVAHEVAHNLLGHRAWLDANGRSQAKIRATEREADRMMPWLLANAGYPPEAAVQFMRQWGPRSAAGALGGIMRRRTHDGWDERAAAIAAELPLIAAAREGSGAADWRARFPAAAAADPAPIR
ncbi:hypothetical protein EYB45_02755 [Erythrobacteraceae bacterium CFH 75059]|uniref:PDZ domain-containing protein n=1 Tax=Qipengyuania thermophila TaxID=2509361 RepID=UPI00101FBE54|nr:PDZ domain-containing protein [Qipengyuania thermophila]TCD06643.1 hypothetical protein EYB45_02755 [Erythrobacteraceae bacterium CFH 75059]